MFCNAAEVEKLLAASDVVLTITASTTASRRAPAPTRLRRAVSPPRDRAARALRPAGGGRRSARARASPSQETSAQHFPAAADALPPGARSSGDWETRLFPRLAERAERCRCTPTAATRCRCARRCCATRRPRTRRCGCCHPRPARAALRLAPAGPCARSPRPRRAARRRLRLHALLLVAAFWRHYLRCATRFGGRVSQKLYALASTTTSTTYCVRVRLTPLAAAAAGRG